MDGGTVPVEALTRRIEQLQLERDELRNDIEQLCIQQGGSGFLTAATRMHFQRATALEQEIENLHKNLAACSREKLNLQEELAEVYRIKSQMADLHSSELSKNKELEKQVKFFQSTVAQAFSERDRSLMECEKAKEQEEAMSKQFNHLKRRIEELQSAYDEQKSLNDKLHLELRELNIQCESFKEVVVKFYEIREREVGFTSLLTLEEKCSCLLSDSSDTWIYTKDGETSTSKYIASLEGERESLKNSIVKLQTNLRMGLEIEQHLKRRVWTLEKKHALFDKNIRNMISALRDFCHNERVEIMKVLEEEESYMQTCTEDIQDRLSKINLISRASTLTLPVLEERQPDSEYKDVHVNIDSGVVQASAADETLDASKALAQALQEKVSVLLLLSQQEERHLLERNMNEAMKEKILELQQSLTQVTGEKVKALMELANLKQEYRLLRESTSSIVKYNNDNLEASAKNLSGQDPRGNLRTYLNRWIRKGVTEDAGKHGTSPENFSSVKTGENPLDHARLKVENAMLHESIANVDRLTSSVHRLHLIVMKAREDAKSSGASDSIYEALNSVITEATLIKTALGAVLPISWCGDASDTIIYSSLCERSEISSPSKAMKADVLFSSVGLELVELLILAAEILRERFLLKTADS